MNVGHRIRNHAAHWLARATGRYYSEDFVRVYPDGIRFDRRGRLRNSTPNDIKNYLNHVKFYQFAAQFVRDRTVADIGCGSGYGCQILSSAGAAEVHGADISREAIQFARSRYGDCAKFTVQGVTALDEFTDGSVDVTVSSEVLEHIKEYRLEKQAMREIMRITKPGGLIVVGTPNSELLGGHGFSFDEINGLFEQHFERFVLLENALLPFGVKRHLWDDRLRSGRTGVVVSEEIIVAETVVPEGAVPEFKQGVPPGILSLGNYNVDTRLLHNTHSWVVLGVRGRLLS